MTVNKELTPDIFDPEEEKYEEEWIVKISTGTEYILGKAQARFLQQAIASGNRGIILFKTFSISIPYIAEFQRIKRFLKEEYQLPDRAKEEPYQPISRERWDEGKAKLKERYPNLWPNPSGKRGSRRKNVNS